jgi:hypothetical protein
MLSKVSSLSFHVKRTSLMVAATGPGSGSVDTSNAVPFKEQVRSPRSRWFKLITGSWIR